MEIQLNMSQVMVNMMTGQMRNAISQAVESCALKYGFSAEEALHDLGVSITLSQGKKLCEKSPKTKKVSPRFPLPFNGEHNDDLCQALRQNNGLYTQCQGSKKTGLYCKSCSQLAGKSEDGIPEYGTISQRLAADTFGYVDPKGRKPTAYTKVMRKYKISQEEALEEASKFGITINQDHFIAPEEPKRGRTPSKPKEVKESKGKGRPKKTTKVVISDDDDDDLFASLVASANEVDEDDEETIAQKKAEKEAEKLAKAQEKEAKLAAAKAEKEAKLAAEKAEKEAKLAAAKAEKEAKLAAEKAEKEAKLAAAKAEKEAKLAAAKAEKEAKLAASKSGKKTKKVEDDEPEETYKKCGQVNGINYIRSQQTGIVYDFDKYANSEELFAVGKWNAEQKEIIFDKVEDDGELSEEEED